MAGTFSGMPALPREQGQPQEVREVPRAAGRFWRSAQGLQDDKRSGAGGHVASSMMFKMLRVARRLADAVPA
jgi:hypothetical protein